MAVNATYCEDAANELYDKLDNYLDHLFPQTEREGNDIDDWRIPKG